MLVRSLELDLNGQLAIAKNNLPSATSMACNLHLFAHLMKQQQSTFRSGAGKSQAQLDQPEPLKNF
jgi:hypothetical protein